MLDKLTDEDFTSHLHQKFSVQIESMEPIELELVDVVKLGEPRESARVRRQAFSIQFLGPVSNLYLQQHVYRIEHEQMGSLDLFLVPLGPENGRMRYEAVFN